MEEESKVKTWVKKHKKEIIIGVMAITVVIAGGTIIYIKSKNGNKPIANVKSTKPKNDVLNKPSTNNNIKAETVSKTPIVKNVSVKKEFIEDEHIQKIPRLTQKNREKILAINNGFETTTYYKGRNVERTRVYKIQDGQVIINETGKTSWADSHYNKTFTADDDETHRFLRNNLLSLNININ